MSLDNSPFADRLNTNYVPSDSEVLEIRALLLDSADELARIDTRIGEVEIALAQLKEQRASFKAPIDAHRALISPMRRIPHDVLVEIFCACLPSEHNALIDFAEAPLVLGRICKHWRSVAYSSPILWSTMHIPWPHFRSIPPQIRSRLEKIVEQWFKRAATCPLSVSFFDDTNYFPSGFDKHPLVLQLLPFSPRLRHLTLTGHPEFLRPLLQLGSEDLPLLKSLVVHYSAHATDFANSKSAFNLSTISNVAIRMVAAIDTHALPLPWGQLTKLRLECDPLGDHQSTMEGGLDFVGAFNVLRKCPVLVHCEFRITLGLGGVESILDTSPIILPHLQTLVLRGRIFFRKWIPNLVAPNLRSLQVGEYTTLDLPLHMNMSVAIDSRYFTSSGVEDLLRSFPLISHLRLKLSLTANNASIANETFRSLGSPHNLCPILVNIAIHGSRPSFSDTAFLTFVKARMATPTPLQQIWMRFTSPMATAEFDIMPELQRFIIADGLQVDVKYPRPAVQFRSREGLPGEDS
ncbi:hypothetical protein C8R45DRAFT_1025916 [Mycena sanguinolenta]|nr:hypothetical protein C8R45DRAFT_1025916 [Mycena sanguinolenta]